MYERNSSEVPEENVAFDSNLLRRIKWGEIYDYYFLYSVLLKYLLFTFRPLHHFSPILSAFFQSVSAPIH